ncbi:uncharacterized protein LOC112453528 [Temnothorax curvispinosus]|uniref:Uncharacterized protein LOC112453528 n=1 Tax=Temnothorax curvispinosus TaxID=300111 RepID=A0A6J1PL36_9HYME|nr:uncharacterized protein LOC112453528 [Temnothorax curvispinosus]
MPSCSIKNCKNNTRNAKNRNITFLGFPRKTEMIEKWKVFCKENINPTSARVCSEHFLPGQFQDKTWLKNLVGDSGRVSKKLLPDAVPMASIVDHSVNTESRTDDTQRNVTSTDHGTNRDQPCESNFVQLVAVASNDENLSHSMTVRTSTCTKNERIDCTSMQAESAACNSVLSNTVTPSTSRSTRKSKKEGQCVAQESDAMLLLKKENRKLKKALAASVSETKLLKRRLATINKRQKKQLQQNVAKKVKNMLSPFFTPAQIRMYMNPKQQKTRWSQEDIAAAISFKSVSPKAYRYIRKLKQIPLPAPSTLRKWITDFNINEGILTDVLSIMKAKSSSMTPMERATVICFDEIYLTNQMQIERKTERVVGPHKRCQVLIARGIFKKWKQPGRLLRV